MSRRPWTREERHRLEMFREPPANQKALFAAFPDRSKSSIRSALQQLRKAPAPDRRRCTRCGLSHTKGLTRKNQEDLCPRCLCPDLPSETVEEVMERGTSESNLWCSRSYSWGEK